MTFFRKAVPHFYCLHAMSLGRLSFASGDAAAKTVAPLDFHASLALPPAVASGRARLCIWGLCEKFLLFWGTFKRHPGTAALIRGENAILSLIFMKFNNFIG